MQLAEAPIDRRDATGAEAGRCPNHLGIRDCQALQVSEFGNQLQLRNTQFGRDPGLLQLLQA